MKKKFGRIEMMPEVQRAGKGDPAQDEVQVLGGRLAGPDAGDEPPYFFMLSATSVGLNVIET